MSFRYRAFSLSLASALPLPELDADAAPGPADVTIAFGAVPAAPPAGGVLLGPFASTGPDWLWLQVPGVASYWVEAGRQILIEPLPGIDEDSLRVFLLGSVIGAVLLQRGHSVLHGNAVAVNGQALVCLGESGAGKSTLALGFAQRGFPVLADDVVAIDDRGRALPGIPRIKIWQDVADQLAIATGSLPRVRPAMAKFSLTVGRLPGLEALPVKWIFLLSQGHVTAVTAAPTEGMAAFEVLRDNLYRPFLVEGMGTQASHLQRLGILAAQAQVVRLKRPLAGFSLTEMIDRVLATMDEPG